MIPFSSLCQPCLDSEYPCGEDVSLSSAFDALRAEVEKGTSLYAEGGTDWQAVQHMAAEILIHNSKDLWVFSYAICGLCHTDGMAACAEALGPFTALINEQWAHVYPPLQRVQRRLAPLLWLHGRLGQQLEALAGFRNHTKDLGPLKACFEQLDLVLETKVGEDAPHFMGLFSRAEPLADTAALPDASTVGTASHGASPTHPTQTARTAHAAQSQHTSLGTALKDMDADGRVPPAVLPQLARTVMDQARQLAGHFLSLNMLDERAYLLSRAALWGTLLHLPPVDKNLQTQLSSGVPQDKIMAYVSGMENQQFATVLPDLERSAAKAPYWLDGHYMVARCLEALNAPTALLSVRAALTGLVGRFPELLTYKFRDGSPFASAKVLPWLEALAHTQPAFARQSTALGSGNAPGHGQGQAQGKANDEDLLHEALVFNAEKGFAAGLQHLQSGVAGKNRQSVLRGLLQAKYCLSAGNKKAAQHVLQALYAHLEQWNMLEWEPELSAQIITLLLSLSPRQSGTERQDMTQRLFWLDINTAVNLLPGT